MSRRFRSAAPPRFETLEDRCVPAANPAHVYDFNGTLDDQLGGPAILADGGTLQDGRYVFGPNQGLRLIGALADRGTYSIEMTFNFPFVPSGYAKVIDFMDRACDPGLYLVNGRTVIYPGDAGNDAAVAGRDTRLTLTRSYDTGEAKVYLNGALQGTYTGFGVGVTWPDGNVLTFFKDDYCTHGFEAVGGSVDSIVIYNRTLTAEEVAAAEPAPVLGTLTVTAQQGSVQVPEGQTATNSGTWSQSSGAAVTLSASVGTVTQNTDGGWSWSLVTADGPAQSTTVTVTAADAQGQTATTTFSLVVDNVAPTITALASDHATLDLAALDGTVNVTGAFTDPGTADTHTVTVDWGDGTAAQTISASAGSIGGSHRYAQGGLYTVTVTVTDKDGGTATQTVSAVVAGAGLSGGTLYVIGTGARDKLVVDVSKQRSGKRGAPEVTSVRVTTESAGPGGFAAKTVRTFDRAQVQRIVVLAGAGDDQVRVHDHVRIDAVLVGGAGNDHLQGGGGRNALSGGAGNDNLHAGKNGDLLVGGAGKDHLHGHKGNDFLAAGAAANGDDVDALRAALDAWVGGATPEAVVAALGAFTWDDAKDHVGDCQGDDYVLTAPVSNPPRPPHGKKK